MKRSDVDTPALILDLDRVERNIETLALFFSSRTANLRPHFKTPKCPEVARRQLAAGAIGITCAKLGEAEVLAHSGIETSILLANQVVGRAKVQRLVELAGSVPELIVAVDHPNQVRAIDAELSGTKQSVGALVEVDIGMHRCGTRDEAATVELAAAVDKSRLSYRGIMGYEGHAVLVVDPEERRALTVQALSELDRHRSALARAGLEPEIVSAGGTGTYDITGAAPFVTELQAGSYVFMDGAYRKVRSEFEPALTVATTVVHARGRLLITDCGMKALSHEFGLPEGADLPLRCVALSEEHGHVLIDDDAELTLDPGDRIEILPSHGDTTINLHEEYAVVRGEEVVDRWPIPARGKFK